MQDLETECPNLPDTVSGLITEPGHMTEILFRQDPPPHIITLLTIFALTLIIPITAQIIKFDLLGYTPILFISTTIIIIFTLLIFVLFEVIFLRTVGVDASLSKVFATLAYAVTPLVLMLLIIYLFNYMANGRLSIITLILTGYSSVDDRFLTVLPIALIIAKLNFLLILFYSIKAMGELEILGAALLTICSILPLYLALIFALLIGELVTPGASDVFIRLIVPTHLSIYHEIIDSKNIFINLLLQILN